MSKASDTPRIADPADVEAELGAENPGPMTQSVLDRIKGWSHEEWDNQIFWDEASVRNWTELTQIPGAPLDNWRPLVRPNHRYGKLPLPIPTSESSEKE